MNYSTVSIPEERYEGLLADWALCGPYSSELQKLTRRGVADRDSFRGTDTDADAIANAVQFLSRFSSGSALSCWARELPENESHRWLDKLLSLRVRSLRSLATGEVSRPLLSQNEIYELAESPLDRLHALRSLYSIVGLEIVERFIDDHHFLVQVLEEAHDILRCFFQENTLRLEHRIDPEVPDDEKLFLYVETRASVGDALAQLDAFEEAWWLDNLDKAHEKLLIDVEFL